MPRPPSSRLFALVLFVVLTGACSTRPAANSSSGLPASPTVQGVPAPTATLRAASTLAAPTAAPPSASAVNPITYPDPALLDRLDGYDLTLRIAFKGTHDGHAAETSSQYTRRFRRSPAAQFTTVDTTDADGKPVKMLFGLVGDVQYSQAAADEPCEAQDKQANYKVMNPASMLRPVRQARLVGAETIGGVPAQHYSLDAASFRPGMPAETRGDLWLADPGGYVVRYELHVQAGEAYFGQGNQGEQTTRFELAKSNGAELAIPQGCPPPSDLVAMSDASDLSRTPWGVSYLTASDARSILTFYRTRLEPLGWTLRASSDQGTTALPGLEGDPASAQISQATAPAAQNARGGWAVFVLAKENKTGTLLYQPEGTLMRVEVLVRSKDAAP